MIAGDNVLNLWSRKEESSNHYVFARRAPDLMALVKTRDKFFASTVKFSRSSARPLRKACTWVNAE